MTLSYQDSAWAASVLAQIPGLPKKPEQRHAVYVALSRVEASRHKEHEELCYLPHECLEADETLSFLPLGARRKLFFGVFTEVAIRCHVRGVQSNALRMTEAGLNFLEAWEVLSSGTEYSPFRVERAWRLSNGHAFRVDLDVKELQRGARELEYADPDAALSLRRLCRRVAEQGHRGGYIVERIAPKADAPRGRLYGMSALPLGTMPKTAREWVMRSVASARWGTQHDVVELDAQGCHMRLLHDLLSENGIQAPEVKKLIENTPALRKEYADELGITTSEVKGILLASMYGAAVDGPSTKNSLPLEVRPLWSRSKLRAMVQKISEAQVDACSILDIPRDAEWRRAFALHMQAKETLGMRAAYRSQAGEVVLWLHDALFLLVPRKADVLDVFGICDAMTEAAKREGVGLVFDIKRRWSV